MNNETPEPVVRLPRDLPTDGAPNRSIVRYGRLGRGLAFAARQMMVDGWDDSRIYSRLRDEGVTLDLIRRWRLGRGYPDALPPGYSARHPRTRWTSARRIAQLPQSVVFEARSMFMDGAPILLVQEFINDEPYLKTVITGIGPRSWVASDLFKILFAVRPAGRRSVPAGYRRWLRTHGREVRRRVLRLEAAAKGRKGTLGHDDVEFLAGTTDLYEAEDDVLRLDVRAHALDQQWSEMQRLEPDELDKALEVHDAKRSDPYHWAGMIMIAARMDRDARTRLGLGKRPAHKSAFTHDVSVASGCTRQEARRALKYVKSKIERGAA